MSSVTKSAAKPADETSAKYTTEIFHDGSRYKTMTYETNPRPGKLQFNHMNMFLWPTQTQTQSPTNKPTSNEK